MINKKGMSLAELIIAVALISVVLVFLYSLLSDIKNEMTNSDFAINNQQNRFEIIKTIQNDLLDETIYEIKKEDSGTKITISYTTNTNDTIIYIDYNANSIKVESKDDLTTTWILDENCFIGSDVSTISSKLANYDDQTFYINIPIYTTNADNISSSSNNTLDDITIYHINN